MEPSAERTSQFGSFLGEERFSATGEQHDKLWVGGEGTFNLKIKDIPSWMKRAMDGQECR